MAYLLDTSVYSQVLKRKPVAAALDRWQLAGDAECRVAMVSVAELEWGLHHENNPERWRKYRALLPGGVRVLPTSETVWHRFAEMKARQRRIGQLVADFDLLIAACAMVHGLTVATLNHTDFSRIEGLLWEDWNIPI